MTRQDSVVKMSLTVQVLSPYFCAQSECSLEIDSSFGLQSILYSLHFAERNIVVHHLSIL